MKSRTVIAVAGTYSATGGPEPTRLHKVDLTIDRTTEDDLSPEQAVRMAHVAALTDEKNVVADEIRDAVNRAARAFGGDFATGERGAGAPPGGAPGAN